MVRATSILALALHVVTAKISCMDETGSPVSSFHILKGNNGDDTWYAKGGKLTQTDSGMGGDKGAIPFTLDQYYNSLPSDYAYAVYNDDDDEGKTSTTRAHAKGVVMFDASSGFWLIHSLPRYPSRRDVGPEDLPSETYAQSFICLTLDTKVGLEAIGKQLQLMWPNIYDGEMSASLAELYPAFDMALNGSHTRGTEPQTATFTTTGGEAFTHYAKAKECECGLYDDVVAPGLKADLYVETWMNGRLDNKIPSSCKSDGFKYNVQDISLVRMPDGTDWAETQDHSKWAVSASASVSTVCVGDINRQYSQADRGGGTMCYKNKDVWQAFSSVVTNFTDPC